MSEAAIILPTPWWRALFDAVAVHANWTVPERDGQGGAIRIVIAIFGGALATNSGRFRSIRLTALPRSSPGSLPQRSRSRSR
jgi:hypothetical protein